MHLDNLYDCLDSNKNNKTNTQYGYVKYSYGREKDSYDYFSEDNKTNTPNCMNQETVELITMTNDYVVLRSEWAPKMLFKLSKKEFYYALSELPDTLEEIFGKEFLEKI